MTHMQIKAGNSFSLSFQNMVLGSLCTTWLCSDYLLLQFLSTSADALSSRPSPPAFWPHLPVRAQNSTALQDTGHHHIKHCQVTRHLCPWSSQTEHMKSERIIRTFLKFKKDHVERKSIVSHSLWHSLKETRLPSLSPASCYTAFCSSDFSSLNLSPHLPVVNLV